MLYSWQAARCVPIPWPQRPSPGSLPDGIEHDEAGQDNLVRGDLHVCIGNTVREEDCGVLIR